MLLSPKRVGYFVIVMAITLIGFDFYLNADSVEGNTYSERIRFWGERYRLLPPALALGFGALVTHWFAKNETRNKTVFLYLLASVCIGMVIGLFW